MDNNKLPTGLSWTSINEILSFLEWPLKIFGILLICLASIVAICLTVHYLLKLFPRGMYHWRLGKQLKNCPRTQLTEIRIDMDKTSKKKKKEDATKEEKEKKAILDNDITGQPPSAGPSAANNG